MTKRELEAQIMEAADSLRKAKSLLCFLDDYFRYATPKPSALLVRYKEYSDMQEAIADIVREQAGNMLKLFNRLDGGECIE